MDIGDAQRDVRTVFMGGFAGQLVCSAVWLVSAALATWQSRRAAIAVLVVGGMFIFPLTQLLLRLMGRPSSLPKGHPMNALGMQTAFVIPLTLPLIGAVALYRLNWFYPAFMICVGAHYLPFIFLYGMWQYGALAAVLVSGGLIIGLYIPSAFSLGGWFTGLVLLTFALIARAAAQQEQRTRKRSAAAAS